MPSVNEWIGLAFLVGVPGALLVHYLGDARRLRSMKAYAEEQGLQFADRDEALDSHPMMHARIFSIGSDRKFLHRMRGTLGGREVLIFDYRHRVGGLLTSVTHNSLIGDAVIGIEENRKPTWYDMTTVALRAPKVGESTRSRAPGMPGGHTRIERAGEWLILYRFDRRVPMDQLQSFTERALTLAKDLEAES